MQNSTLASVWDMWYNVLRHDDGATWFTFATVAVPVWIVFTVIRRYA